MKEFAAVAGLALLVACGGGGQSNANKVNRDTLTERQKDSILAKSSIPGASAVGRAMNAADSTSARVTASDSVH
ncbi:MAG TPA: hypothetical protein VKB63_10380 [Gemmatimonadales bacterium]|nr:hypothetical protein [Gemmatimonadales bacterium]